MNYDREQWKNAALTACGIIPSSVRGKLVCAQFDVLMDKIDELGGVEFPPSRYVKCKDERCDCCKICNRITCICGMKVWNESFFHCDCSLMRRMKPMPHTECPIPNDKELKKDIVEFLEAIDRFVSASKVCLNDLLKKYL